MTAALALLTGREFLIGFLVGGVVFGFGAIAICRAKLYDAGYVTSADGWITRPRTRSAFTTGRGRS